MANLKITQLPAATALTGDEIVPVVQAGQTRRATAAAVAGLHRGIWQAPAFNAPWSNYGSGYTLAGFRRNGDRVELRGLIKGGGGGTVAFVLPIGFRPTTQHLFSVVCDTLSATRVDVKVNGDVQVTLPSSGVVGFLSLDGLSFSME
ncbi:hypothetical protein [Pseudomonas sp. CGJS7]|uniref:hypothetical protein n=1 Tax=Pseudomonas sp. CGJS7 TaxID=3109348 RepID=UPI00300A8FFA